MSQKATTAQATSAASASGRTGDGFVSRIRNVVSMRSRDASGFRGVGSPSRMMTASSGDGVATPCTAARGFPAKLAASSPSVVETSIGTGVTDGFSPLRSARTPGSRTGGSKGAWGGCSSAADGLRGLAGAGLEALDRSSSLFMGHPARVPYIAGDCGAK